MIKQLSISIDGYELLNSMTINLFNRIFTVCFENLIFNVEFLSKKSGNASAEYVKSEHGETATFNIKIYDADTDFHGILDPMKIGEADGYNYYISLIGMYGFKNYRQVTFNLLRRSF